MKRLTSRRWSVAAALICGGSLLLSGSGCSLVFVRPPRAGAEGATPAEPPRCTESRAAPAADTAIGGTLLFLAVVGLAGYAQGCDSSGWFRCMGRDMGGALAIGAGIPSAAFLGSAWYGYRKTGQCRRTRAQTSACDPADCDGAEVSWMPPPRVATLGGAPFSPSFPALRLRDVPEAAVDAARAER